MSGRDEVLDRLIERVKTMPPNGVVSRWEDVSRSAVIDLLLEARADQSPTPPPKTEPVTTCGHSVAEDLAILDTIHRKLFGAAEALAPTRSLRHRLGDLLGHRPGCDERCGHDRSCWP